jgi:hypothetical protein
MITCKKCGIEFSSYVVINNERKNIKNRKYCLDCVPFKSKNTTSLDRNRICQSCGRKYFYDRKKGHKTTECNSCATNKKRFYLKPKMIEYKGGKCKNCGYNKCIQALDFHHRDPQEKDFNLGGKHCYSWKRLKKELDKCDLLCSNCHREEHAKNYTYSLTGKALRL